LTVKQGGNPNLKPETSRQRTVGLVFQPTRDMQFSADFWRVRIDGQIGIPDADRAADVTGTTVLATGSGGPPDKWVASKPASGRQ
jgi:outer membrane receptor protein involved in Fe transport